MRTGAVLSLAAVAVVLASTPIMRFDPDLPTRVEVGDQAHKSALRERTHNGLPVYSTAVVEQSQGTGLGFGPGSFASGFEPPCSTTLNGNGYIGGGGSGLPQNCDWHASTAAQPTYIQPHIDDVIPLNGTQHLRFQYDPNQTTGSPDLTADPGSRNWAFSDDIVPTPTEGVVHLSLNVRVSGIANPGDNQNAYVIQPQAPTQGALTTVFILNENGTISVGDDGTGCGDGFFNIIDTGVPWVIDGNYHNLHLCLDTFNDRIRYFYDGDLVYSTGLGEGGLGGPAGCGVFAGSIIEHVLIRYEANSNDGSFLDVDDVEIADDGCLEPLGACCIAGSPDTCEQMGLDACADAGGVFAGVGTECTDPLELLCDLAFTCGASAESCFEAHATPGCEDVACCVIICSADDFCCDTEWDDSCVNQAEGSGACLPSSICPHCTGNCTINTSCQQLSVANASTSTTGSFTVAEGFAPAANGSVNSICWNGAYLPGTNITDNFTVTYYDCDEVDNPGVPGAVIASFSQSGGSLVHNPATQKIDTNLLVAETAPIYEYHATHANVPVQAGERYFVEIVNTTATGETWFWEWAVDPEGDGASFQKPPGIGEYARWSRQTTDVAFCLNIQLADQTDVCPLPPPEACELDVAGADVEENEPCANDPDLNIACSADPAGNFTELGSGLSTDPANPTVIHGVAWAETDALPEQDRDIDYYRFTVPAGVDGNGDGMVYACLAVASELPIQGQVAELTGGICPATLAALDTVGFNCEASLAVGYEIPLGTHAILMRTADAGEEVFDGFPCGGGAPCPEDCDVDQVGNPTPDGNVATADLLQLLGDWGGPSNCDFDGNGVVSTSDLLQLLGAWGPCPSPFGNDYLYEIAFADTFEECFPALPVNAPIVVKAKKGAGRLLVEFND